MLWKRIWTAGSSVALLGLAMSAGGCIHVPSRHGLILRGDWSLELNRAPWLAGRESTYQESSSQSSCESVILPPDPVVGCATEVLLPMEEVTPPALETSNAMGVYESGYAPACDTRPCPPIGARVFGALARLRPGFRAIEPEAVGYYNHPRFHPLPTGPVFTPAPREEFAPPIEPPPSQAAEPTPDPAVNTPPEPLPAPAPAPASAPATPAAEARWESRSGNASVTSKTRSWVFPPPRKRPAPLPPDRYVHSAALPIPQ